MFNFRYHVVSIIAIFLALAIGILLGVTIANRVVSSAERQLVRSLRDDLNNSRERESKIRRDLNVRDNFENLIYPRLVGNNLDGYDVAVVGLGSLPQKTVSDVREALEPTGANISLIATVESPIPVEKLEEKLKGGKYADLTSDEGELASFAEQAGKDLVAGDGLTAKNAQTLFSSQSGKFEPVDAVIYPRVSRDLDAEDERAVATFENSMSKGMTAQDVPVIGVERSDDSEGEKDSQVAYFRDHDITSVDDIELIAGKVALVYAILGAKGQFGVQPGAQLIPQANLSGNTR